MFTQEQQRRYFIKKSRRICHLLCSIREPAIDAEILHDIRVACKHLKALAALVNYCNEPHERISLRKLNALYSLAGRIRNAQVVCLQLEKFNIHCSSLYIEQRSIIELESTDLFLHRQKFKMEIEALQEQIRFRQAISCESIIDYYFMQVQKLSFILSLPEDIILLHEARKIIKRLLLPIPFLPPAIHNKLGIDVQTFDRIQQEIGDMHDAVITSELIKEKECDPGYPAGIKDYNILNFYTTVRTGFSIN